MRIARRPRVRLAALVLLVALAPALGARPPAKNEEELRELRLRIERLQKDLSEAERSRGGALEQLRTTEKAVSAAHRAVFETSERRKEIEAELAALADRDRETRAGLAAEQALAERLLRLQQRQGARDRLRLVLEGRDAATVARHLAYYGYIQRMRAEVIAALREKAAALGALEREAAGRREALDANLAEQEREARRLAAERQAHAALAQRLAGEIARGQREIGRLKRDESRLARLVEEIARALAAKTAPAPRRGPARKVDRVADASVAATPFESLKGRLRLPVRGEIANTYGGSRDETGATWKGLFIRSITGETVHAVADGRVVYADWLRGFGNLLILDHGSGFMSLYGNNEGLVRKVGDTVRAGDPIARVGAVGHEESGLYFELRRDGKTFDPMRWVAP